MTQSLESKYRELCMLLDELSGQVRMADDYLNSVAYALDYGPPPDYTSALIARDLDLLEDQIQAAWAGLLKFQCSRHVLNRPTATA